MVLYLVGYMYSGKTTIGHQLAELTGYTFHDLDQALEARYHSSVPILFERYGESLFRQLETAQLHATEGMTDTIVCTGGGTACFNNNMEWINTHGTSIYLRLSPSSLQQRMELSRKRRPIIAAVNPQERNTFIENQLAARLPHYLEAQHVIVCDEMNNNQICDYIINNIMRG